jgi:hypothetical protein
MAQKNNTKMTFDLDDHFHDLSSVYSGHSLDVAASAGNPENFLIC